MDKKMYELKPCPFCGGEARIIPGYSLYYVHCCECTAKGPTFASKENAKENAVKAWNRRYNDK